MKQKILAAVSLCALISLAMGKAMGSVADMFKGKRPFDAADVATAGDDIIKHSARLGELFPDTEASRLGKHTAALPAIWQDKDAFLSLATELKQRAESLKAAASTGDQDKIKAAFAKTAKSCSSCHADFRKKKE